MAYRKASVPVIVGPVFVNGVTAMRAMSRKGAYVVAVDSKPEAVGFSSRYAREKALIATPEDDANAFSNWLLSRQDLYGGIVIPTDDMWVRDLHANYDRLSSHYKVAVSPGESTAIALDKRRACEAAARAGGPVPVTVLVRNETDLAAAASRTGFPALLRASFSLPFVKEFHIKNFRVASLDEAVRMLRVALASGHEMLLQELIPGDDYNVVSAKFYVTGAGDIPAILPGVKVLQNPPLAGTGCLQQACRIPEVERLTRAVLREVGYCGAIGSMEWKYDARDGLWKFIEINARSLMSVGIMEYVGVDVFQMLWRDKLGLEPLPVTRIRYGRRWAYLKDCLLRHRGYPEHRRTLMEYARLFRPPIRLGLLDISDLKPFFLDMAPFLRRRFSRRSRGA